MVEDSQKPSLGQVLADSFKRTEDERSRSARNYIASWFEQIKSQIPNEVTKSNPKTKWTIKAPKNLFPKIDGIDYPTGILNEEWGKFKIWLEENGLYGVFLQRLHVNLLIQLSPQYEFFVRIGLEPPHDNYTIMLGEAFSNRK